VINILKQKVKGQGQGHKINLLLAISVCYQDLKLKNKIITQKFKFGTNVKRFHKAQAQNAS